MKKHLSIIVFCLMAISITVQAQHRPPHHGGKHHIEKMKAELNLTDEQVQQIQTMDESMKKEMDAIHESDLPREEKHAKMKAFMDAKKQKMDAILTAEQKQKMEAHHAEMEAKHLERKESMKAVHEKMKQFKQETVMPFISAKRTELDKSIKKKDRKEVEKLRAIVKDIHKEVKAKRDAMKGDFEKGERPPHHGMKGKGHGGHGKMEMMIFMKEHETEFKQAEALATKYATEIDQLMEEIQAEEKTWKSEMKDMKGEHPRGEGMERHGKQEGKACEKGKLSSDKQHGKKGKTAEEMKEKMKQMKRIGFLLMPSEMDKEEVKAKETITAATLEAKVYPNPSSNSNTLEINIVEKGNYSIELFNESGSKVKEITKAKLEQGKQEFPVDLSNLPTGIYYYVISDGKTKTTQKFVKN